MKKTFTKLLALLLALVCGMTAFAGCDRTTEEEKSQTLYVAAINKGYGIKWLDALLEKFCGDRNLKYKIIPAYEDSAISSVVEAGKGYCDYDLVFTGSRNGIGDEYLADLTSLVTEYKIESGDRAGKTIKELLGSELADTFNEEYLLGGEYYNVLPWTAGMTSLLFNVNVMKETFGENWREQYPVRTTNELLKLCEALKAKGKYSFINAGSNAQNTGAFNTAYNQYVGLEGLKDFYNGVYYDEDAGEYKEGPGIMKEQGILEGLKVLESLMYKQDGGYVYPSSHGLGWEESDTFFMMGYAAMKYAGDWTQLENLKNFPDVELEYVRAPIVSALGTKLGITEEQLIELIDYVDAVKNGKTAAKPSVSTDKMTTDQLIDRVYEARSIYHSYVDQFVVSVVDYNKKELGIEFLKFMVSDEGQSIFFEKSNGLSQPYGYDVSKDPAYANIGTFAKSRWQISKDQIYAHAFGHLKFGSVGLHVMPYNDDVQPADSAMAQGKVNAEDIFNYGFKTNSSQWDTFVMLSNKKFVKK